MSSHDAIPASGAVRQQHVKSRRKANILPPAKSSQSRRIYCNKLWRKGPNCVLSVVSFSFAGEAGGSIVYRMGLSQAKELTDRRRYVNPPLINASRPNLTTFYSSTHMEFCCWKGCCKNCKNQPAFSKTTDLDVGSVRVVYRQAQ